MDLILLYGLPGSGKKTVGQLLEKKTEYLKEMAREAADDVSLTRKEKELPPMPPYERRIIHTEISQRTDVLSESAGQEPERRIVIKPRP